MFFRLISTNLFLYFVTTSANLLKTTFFDLFYCNFITFSPQFEQTHNFLQIKLRENSIFLLKVKFEKKNQPKL